MSRLKTGASVSVIKIAYTESLLERHSLVSFFCVAAKGKVKVSIANANESWRNFRVARDVGD